MKNFIIIFLIFVAFLGFIFYNNTKHEQIQIKINGISINAELADTPQKRFKGLMHRNDLKENEGMFFIFDHEGSHSFWMKNTLMNLDMIWLNSSKEIVYIEHSAPPCGQEPCTTYRSPTKAKYVLEMNGGWSINNNINIGQKVEFD